MRSDVRGIALVSLARLPRSPEDGSLDRYCDGYQAKRLTSVGKLVAKLGWIVASEAPLGRYRVVTFASGFTPGTSALCFARNANIGIFGGGKLVALAYKSGSGAGPLGRVEALEGGGLLIWTDPPGWPIGELHEANGALHVTTIAPQQSFCRGRAVVPDVYGMRIEKARKRLVAHGWRPQRASEPPGFEATALLQRGVVEVEACSGTGVGYCAFRYRGAAGVLGVTTAGEYDKVVGYQVACASARPR